MRSFVTLCFPESEVGRVYGISNAAEQWSSRRGRSLRPRHFDRIAMVVENLRQRGARKPAEATISRQAEARQEFTRRRDAFIEPFHVVDSAEIDARAVRFQVRQRTEEGIIAAIEHRKVDP